MEKTQNAQSVYHEVRCPLGPRKLLAKMRVQEDTEAIKRIVDNLLELSCRDCTKSARRKAESLGLPTPVRVLHRFNIAGEHVETVEEY